MNQIGYDALTIGNHEFDINNKDLLEALKMAEFPILSCNIINKETGELVDFAKPYVVIEKMGIRFGIIGLTTTDTELMSFPDNIAGIDFVDEKQALRKWIPIVREKADIIILLGHMGLPYDPPSMYEYRYGKDINKTSDERRWGWDVQEIAHEVEGIDLIIGGHMHKGFPTPWADPLTHTLCMQGYAYGSNLNVLTLKIDKETKTISGWETIDKSAGISVTLFEDEFIPVPEIAEAIQADQIVAEKGMDEIIGESKVYLSKEGADAQNRMGNLMTDAMRDVVNADFGFMNLGSVRGTIASGPISYRDVFTVMPFDNQVVTFECTGKFLKEIIETRIEGGRHGVLVSGGKVVYSKKRDNFDRVTSFEIQGQPWDPDKIYKVATTDFLMGGNAGLSLLTKVPQEDINNYNINLRDAIVDYIKKYSPIRTDIDDRWIRNDRGDYSPEMKKALNK
jgi:2',3'-cyclic-nucleotide 2'-phosphodiesterase (5'-nucleotidase family)